MRKYIDGKRYDTEAAKELGHWENGYRLGDFNYVSEVLYRKKNGEYFLYGEGGPRSVYARSRGEDGTVSGADILPLSYEEACSWAQSRLGAEEYDTLFGPIPEDDSLVRTHISLSAATLERAKRAADQRGMGLSAYVETALDKITKGDITP